MIVPLMSTETNHKVSVALHLPVEYADRESVSGVVLLLLVTVNKRSFLLKTCFFNEIRYIIITKSGLPVL